MSNIEFRYGNNLVIDGKIPWLNVLPVPDGLERYVIATSNELYTLLRVGGTAIRYAITELHEHNKELHGDNIARPSILLAQMAVHEQAERAKGLVYTEKGWAKGGVRAERDDLREPFREYWDAAEEAGFYPVVHVLSGEGRGPTLAIDDVEKEY